MTSFAIDVRPMFVLIIIFMKYYFFIKFSTVAATILLRLLLLLLLLLLIIIMFCALQYESWPSLGLCTCLSNSKAKRHRNPKIGAWVTSIACQFAVQRLQVKVTRRQRHQWWLQTRPHYR